MSANKSDDVVLFQGLDKGGIMRIAEAAKRQSIWEEIVPGLDSIALKFDPAVVDNAQLDQLCQQLRATTEQAQDRTNAAITSASVTLPICYDPEFGPDQAMVADRLGISLTDLPDWHQRQIWEVAMLGFLPGFAYLRCDGDFPDIARLADPRQRLAAGSVGLLGTQCGIYALPGPGGWPIIGRVAARLFDTGKNPPALLQAGQPVQFSAIARRDFDALDSGPS